MATLYGVAFVVFRQMGKQRWPYLCAYMILPLRRNHGTQATITYPFRERFFAVTFSVRHL
jgi:hypothetical protein